MIKFWLKDWNWLTLIEKRSKLYLNSDRQLDRPLGILFVCNQQSNSDSLKSRTSTIQKKKLKFSGFPLDINNLISYSMTMCQCHLLPHPLMTSHKFIGFLTPSFPFCHTRLCVLHSFAPSHYLLDHIYEQPFIYEMNHIKLFNIEGWVYLATFFVS